MKNNVNQSMAIVSAALLIGLSTLLVNVSPVIIGAAGKHEIVTEDKLGLLIAPGLLAVFLICPFMLRWVRVVNWKLLVSAGSLLAALSYVLAAQASSLTGMLICFFFAGIGSGTLYSIGMCCIGDSKHPDRNFGIAAVMQTLTSAVMMYAVPAWIEPAWGFSGLMLVFALLGLVSAVLTFWFPSRGNLSPLAEVLPSPDSAAKDRAIILPWLALLAVYLFFAGVSTLWTYFEIFAYGFNFPEAFVTNTLTIAVLAGGLGAFLPVILGSRYKRLWLIIATNLALMAIVLQLQYAYKQYDFFILSLGFYLCSSMALPYYFAAIASLDYKGKVVVLIPAVIAAAAATGSVIAGPLYALSPAALVIVTCVLVACGLAMHICTELLTKCWAIDAEPATKKAEPKSEQIV